jgi:hypothetical protein
MQAPYNFEQHCWETCEQIEYKKGSLHRWFPSYSVQDQQESVGNGKKKSNSLNKKLLKQ